MMILIKTYQVIMTLPQAILNAVMLLSVVVALGMVSLTSLLYYSLILLKYGRKKGDVWIKYKIKKVKKWL